MEKFTIHGLDCAHCAQKLEDKLNKNKYVKECTINFASSTLFINRYELLSDDELVKIVHSVEPHAELISKTKKTNHHEEECGCGHHHEHHQHEEECGCGHNYEHHHHEEECECGHHYEHHHHEEECDCGHHHEHHHHEEECGCGQHHEHHHHEEECGCGHHHEHHHNEEECGCGHHHGHHHHEEECDCGHHHGHHHHEEECGCGHHHEHHHHEEECGCGHHHEHHHHDEYDERQLSGKKVKSYLVEGLDCAHCALKVEDAIKKLECVEDAVLNFSTLTLHVKLLNEIEENTLISLLQNTANSIEKGVRVTSNHKKEIKQKPLFDFKENILFVLGIVVFIVSLFLSGSIAFVGFVLSYILIGKDVILKALSNIMRGQVFDENFLMCIASIGAFVIGEYKEAVAVVLFYSIGEIFQSYAVNKTRTSISALMDIKSEYANVKTSNGLVKVDPQDVHINDIIVVKVGEKVPLDGVVVKGHSSLDTSSLTGESMPRNVAVNDEVLAGVINLSEVLEMKVTKHYDDSTVSKIIELIENAASKKAPIERFITRFARVYTPTVVVLAIMLAILPMLLLKDAVFTDWLYRALTFLVVSCPCALVISIPLGLYAGLGKASKIGALVKGGNYLELLKDVDTIVFDKTGTLTHGSFFVVEVNGDEDLLELGAYGEYYSNHPIGQSIVKNYDKHIDVKRISHYKEIAGKGIDVCVDHKQLLLGNDSFLNEHGIEVKDTSTIGTIVHVAYDNEYKGFIVVSDKIKETSKNAIQMLKQAGIKQTVMLTGDRDKVAKTVANELGIDKVYSELLPTDKVYKVESLLKNSTVAFVGDGINDAPVLARADVGIAMGGVGSDAAIEAADIVLMHDNIETIAETLHISKKTNAILKQNVVFTLVVKIGVLLLTVFGLSNMWMGVFADVGVTLIAILNSMRILK